MIVHLLLAAAAVLLLWPSAPKPATPSPLLPSLPPAQPSPPKYIEAVVALQVVRHRLAETGLLTEKEQGQINLLMLALVAGSEK